MEKGELVMAIEDLFFSPPGTIQEVTEGQDAAGAVTEDWADYIVDVPGSLQALSASERAAYKKLEVVASFKWFILPQAKAVTEKMRVVFPGGRTFDIVFNDQWHLDGIAPSTHHWTLLLEERK